METKAWRCEGAGCYSLAVDGCHVVRTGNCVDHRTAAVMMLVALLLHLLVKLLLRLAFDVSNLHLVSSRSCSIRSGRTLFAHAVVLMLMLHMLRPLRPDADPFAANA